MSQENGDNRQKATKKGVTNDHLTGDQAILLKSDESDHAADTSFTATATAFDRWLLRELRLVSAALALPIPPRIRDLIEGHRKITK